MGNHGAEVGLAEAARLLGMPKAQVRRLVEGGHLGARRAVSETLISGESVEGLHVSERVRRREALVELADLQNELGLTD